MTPFVVLKLLASGIALGLWAVVEAVCSGPVVLVVGFAVVLVAVAVTERELVRWRRRCQ